MAVFSKILTMLRGNLREIGQSVVDNNASSIYEQEIVDAKKHVAMAKHDLTAVMAKEIQAEREINRLAAETSHFENLALQALQKNETALAEEVAGRVANLEVASAEQTKARAEFAGHVTRLKNLIRDAETTLREHERQLTMAKTTESVYKATATISQSMGASGSKLMTAKESLERIKQRHQEMSDRMQAAETLDDEFGNKTLESKLAAAGIGENVNRKNEVMARLQARLQADNGAKNTSSTPPLQSQDK